MNKCSSLLTNTCLWFVFCLHPLTAQAFFGGKGSAHRSNTRFDDVFRPLNIETQWIATYDAGIIGGYAFSPYASFLCEVLWTQKGYKQRWDENRSFTQKIDYLEIHLQTKVTLPLGKYQPFAQAGIFVERLIQVKKSAIPPLTTGEEVHPYQSDIGRTFGYGLRGSIGIGRQAFHGYIQLGLGYSLSLRDLLQSDILHTQTPFESKHYAWFITLNYIYSFYKKKPKNPKDS